MGDRKSFQQEGVLPTSPLHFLSSAGAIGTAVFGRKQTGLAVVGEHDDEGKGVEYAIKTDPLKEWVGKQHMGLVSVELSKPAT